MNSRVRGTRGGSVELRAGHLKARLTGDVAGARLLAVGSDGRDRQDSRDSEQALTVPATAGDVILTVVPASGSEFAPGTRVGLDLEVVAGEDTQGLPSAVDVPQLDVGALRSFEFVSCRIDGASWRMGLGIPAPSVFEFVEHGELIERLDEREARWVGRGRYIARRARGGEDRSPSGRRWSLALDSSASFLRTLDLAQISDAAQVLAGLLAEETGSGPVWLGATGLTGPIRSEVGPEAFGGQTLDPARPASWCIAAPAMSQALEAGAQTVVFLMDSLPADLPDVQRALDSSPGTTVLFVVVGAGPRGGQSWEEGGGTGPRVALLPPGVDLPVDAWDWTSVCAALDSGVR